jgi:hypothetical protein
MAGAKVNKETKELPQSYCNRWIQKVNQWRKSAFIIDNKINKEPIEILPNWYKITFKHHLVKYGYLLESGRHGYKSNL